MNSIKKILGIIFIFLIGIIVSCGEQNTQSNNDKIKIICTTDVISEAISNILPLNFDVQSLMGPGVDPHT